MEMLRITGLHKRFGDKTVLNRLDLTVPEHSVFGFIGKNGAGKTTTMKTVLGLLKSDTGEIFVNGEQVVYGETVTNRHIGYLPDVPEFYPFMTAPEYLRFCGEITGMQKTDIANRSKELLELVGLEGERHRIQGFSRGMKQRLGIAQALLNRPKLLICDEPTSALDPVGRKEILDILQTVRTQTTVLFSTHILSDVERICTDVAFLDQGTVRVQGKLADIRTKYRREEYILETEREADALRLRTAFPAIRAEGPNRLIFCESGKNAVFDVLRFVTEQRIPLLKMERAEPSLESLFLEVLEQ
ncbi:MAG: ABC transporter ATP-binding protein [Clostridia bacterium]|nr:ABC transporter ATP-binding protein [Clostridia bacterium]